MSKLVLTAIQAVTEKVTIIIRQIPIYITNNSAPSFRQIGGWKDFKRRSLLLEREKNFIPTYYFYEKTDYIRP
jgi:hypothetical protein